MKAKQNMPEQRTRKFYIVGVTHVDLAWKRGRREMTEMLETFVIRLLDALDREPNFHYMIEQAAHYKTLSETRPDLIARLKPHLHSGRLEMVGGMASTLENNLPCGESFVRNQAIGRKWVRENLGVEVRTGWLFDTFGVHAQVPQILAQFGVTTCMANRFGGATFHDIFHARGLDGTLLLMVGRETYSAFVRRENTARVFYHNWDGITRLFREGDALPGDGPLLLIPYVENEYQLSLEPLRISEERNAHRSDESYQLATPGDYFAALNAKLRQIGSTIPVVHGDLNPEFTGCFSLRPAIRLRNRKAETLLLEAEKWSSLQGLTGWESALEAAWWDMAFVQFHDVFTGSHPTPVFREVEQAFERIEQSGTQILTRALESLAPVTAGTNANSLLVANGLPWERTDTVRVPLSMDECVVGVTDHAGEPVPFTQQNHELRFLARVPAIGCAPYSVERVAGGFDPMTAEVVESAAIENEFISLEVDGVVGIRRLVWKPTGAVLMENAGDFLVAQRDDGTFQIESPNGAEVSAAAGTLRVALDAPSALGQSLWLSGAFPDLSWAKADNALTWEAEFRLVTGKPRLDLVLRLHWKGEGTRLRLKIPTTINSSEGIFEIPFGTVARKPYGIRGNARGEWPAHRFVAIEDNTHGIALANTGVGGVEVGGGTLWTTLLRAPKAEGVGMNPDDTSSQHGAHEFTFALIPYRGTWSRAGVAEAAQEINNALLTVTPSNTALPTSFLRLEAESLVLSAVKAAEDGSGDLLVRVYETAGRDSEGILTVRDVVAGWHSDLREQKGEPFACSSDQILFSVKAYEIKTLRFRRISPLSPVSGSKGDETKP